MAVRVRLLLSMILWGGSFVANHELLRALDSLQIVTVRYVLTAVGFGVMLAASPALRPHLTRREWWLMVLSAVLAVPLAQIPVVQGLRYLSPGLASFIVTMSPAFATLLAVLVLKERVRGVQVLGVAVALAGAAAVILFARGGTDLTVTNPAGAALVILTPLAWAGYTIVSKPLAASHRPLTAVASVIVVGALLMAPLYPHTAAALPDLSVAQWGWVLYLAVPGTVIPYVVWFDSLKHLSATSTAAALYLVPVAALGWSVTLLHERLTLVGVIGATLIVAGVALVQFSAPRGTPAAPGVAASTGGGTP